MKPEEFDAGIKEVEAARGKTYGESHHDLLRALFEDFNRLTAKSWMEVCDVMRKLPRSWLPTVGEFWEIRRQLPSLEYERDGQRKVCGECHEGVRYWLTRHERHDYLTPAITHSVARCRCLAGERWTGFPTMEHVEKRPDFVGWIGKEIPEEAVNRLRVQAGGAA